MWVITPTPKSIDTHACHATCVRGVFDGKHWLDEQLGSLVLVFERQPVRCLLRRPRELHSLEAWPHWHDAICSQDNHFQIKSAHWLNILCHFSPRLKSQQRIMPMITSPRLILNPLNAEGLGTAPLHENVNSLLVLSWGCFYDGHMCCVEAPEKFWERSWIWRTSIFSIEKWDLVDVK